MLREVNYTHFNKPWLPAWVRKDSDLHRRASEMLSVLKAVSDSDDVGCSLQAGLAAAYRARQAACFSASEEAHPRKRRRVSLPLDPSQGGAGGTGGRQQQGDQDAERLLALTADTLPVVHGAGAVQWQNGEGGIGGRQELVGPHCE